MIVPNVFLDAMLADVEAHGEEKVLLDRCHDRDFCAMVSVSYDDPRVYTKLKELMLNYREEKQWQKK